MQNTVPRKRACRLIGSLAFIALAPAAIAAQYAYLANGATPHDIAIMDIETRTVVSGPVRVRDYHMAAAISADGDRLFALSRDANATSVGHLTVIATAGGAVLSSFAVGRNPQDVAASPDGTWIYVVNSADRTLSVIDAGSLGQSTVAMPICGSRLAVSPDSRYVYVACGGDVAVYDAQTRTFGTPRRVFATEGIVDLVVHPDGGGIWLLGNSGLGTGKVAAIFATTLDTAFTVDLDQWPRALAVNPDGRSLYVGIATIAPSGQLLAIDTETRAVRATLPMPDGPRAIGVSQDGREAYVTTFIGPTAIVDLQLGSVTGQLQNDATFGEIVVGPGPLATATLRTIVEFYNEKLDHYFVTGYLNEMNDLDSGVHKGWKRTGYTFDGFEAGRSRGHGGPVCRFYGKPSAGLDSHFYSGHRAECDAVERRLGHAWQLEGFRVFDITLPNLLTGRCPYRTVPVYRLWNKRGDSNHRYTTSRDVWSEMQAQGFQPEGYGADGIALCAVAPQ
jgi:DNA-binding beta-propeller fold protein YncE